MEKRLGFVGVVINERKKNSAAVNNILSEHGDGIVARVGLPDADEAGSVITLITKMTTDELGNLTGKLGMLNGVQVRSAVCKQSV